MEQDEQVVLDLIEEGSHMGADADLLKLAYWIARQIAEIDRQFGLLRLYFSPLVTEEQCNQARHHICQRLLIEQIYVQELTPGLS